MFVDSEKRLLLNGLTMNWLVYERLKKNIMAENVTDTVIIDSEIYISQKKKNESKKKSCKTHKVVVVDNEGFGRI